MPAQQAPVRFCEDPDCDNDDPAPPGTRRTRCKACGLLVCPWCFNHVHALAHTKAVDGGQRPQVHTPKERR